MASLSSLCLGAGNQYSGPRRFAVLFAAQVLHWENPHRLLLAPSSGWIPAAVPYDEPAFRANRFVSCPFLLAIPN